MELTDMIDLSCHCGAVKLQVPTPPENVAECNCSICSKLGVLWAYYPAEEVTRVTSEDAKDTYVWGDEMIRFCRCKNCGCTTHWESIDPSFTERMGVNARLMSDLDLKEIPLRHTDGASM